MSGLVFLGVKIAYLLKGSKKIKRITGFCKALVVSDNVNLSLKINSALQLSAEIISAEALLNKSLEVLPMHCFLDMNYLSYSKAIRLIEKHTDKDIYFRFIPKSTQFALGSDSSEGLGIVISY